RRSPGFNRYAGSSTLGFSSTERYNWQHLGFASALFPPSDRRSMTALTGRPTAARRWKWLALAALMGLILAGLYPLSRYLWADSKYQSALAAAESRDFAAARADFDRCMREWPESAEVRFQAARCARRAGDFEAAGNLLRDAKRLGWVQEAIELESVLA